jgi:hypothetical protein
LLFLSILAQNSDILNQQKQNTERRDHKEDHMGTLLVLLLASVAFALAAIHWGYMSNDGPQSLEWERRAQSTWRIDPGCRPGVRHL